MILSDTWPLESLNATHLLKPPSLNSNPLVTPQACPCSDILSSISFAAISFSLDLHLFTESCHNLCLLSVVLVLFAHKDPLLGSLLKTTNHYQTKITQKCLWASFSCSLLCIVTFILLFTYLVGLTKGLSDCSQRKKEKKRKKKHVLKSIKFSSLFNSVHNCIMETKQN